MAKIQYLSSKELFKCILYKLEWKDMIFVLCSVINSNTWNIFKSYFCFFRPHLCVHFSDHQYDFTQNGEIRCNTAVSYTVSLMKLLNKALSLHYKAGKKHSL